MNNKVRDFLFENKVVLLFLSITLFAFWASGLSTVVFFSELFTRFGRNTFMVLALLIPVIAGLGLNFGIVVGAMAAQISMFLVILWGGDGVSGIFSVALLATPIAIVLGYLVGRLFNSMKGSEMIGGMVTSLFADGFYQFLFLFVFGGIIPIAYARLMTSTGVGVLNAIDLGDMRQALDNISMFHILNVSFFVMLAFVALLLIYRLVKKQPIKMFGPTGLIKPLVILGFLLIGYILTWTVTPFLLFTYENRLNGVYASRLVAIIISAVQIYHIIRDIRDEKRPGLPIKRFVILGLVAVGFLVTLLPEISNGLAHVRIPVFTYMIIGGLCLFIKWFINTRLGQNMRTIGQDRNVATAAGINVDRTRIIAMIMSTVLAAYGQIIIIQSFGVMTTYGAHMNVGLYAIAALLVGGATVTRASVKHAIIGVLLFHSLFILAPAASTNLMGAALFGEYFRVFAANAVIALALIMHAWKRVKKRKNEKAKATAA
ncbi:MAG: ABC transporter permease [Defluviitaleaceae bacterium]|nr:ABC transporter permease [Defluviitaleaceae bacterium]